MFGPGHRDNPFLKRANRPVGDFEMPSIQGCEIRFRAYCYFNVKSANKRIIF
jgi:hypothetical protein